MNPMGSFSTKHKEGRLAQSLAAKRRAMRLPDSTTLITLTFIGLIVGAPSFNGSAIAANVQAKPAHEGHTVLPMRRRSAHYDCPPHMVPTAMYFNGVRVCVDPHGYYEWSDGSTSPGPISQPPFALPRNAK
jgi:hypothetical protein